MHIQAAALFSTCLVPLLLAVPLSESAGLTSSADADPRTCPEFSATRMRFEQHTVRLPAAKRGCHLVTDKILKEILPSLSGMKVGLANVFIQHTSASLTINENADPDVRKDMETFLSQTVPEGPRAPWVHTDEGPDDMPAHVKASMFGASLTIPITQGRLNLGTWQGIWLCEHRDHASGRSIIVTLQGE